MREYVKVGESCAEAFGKYPFLTAFVYIDENGVGMSSELVNDYLGKDMFQKYRAISASDINYLLSVAEQRGDI